MRRPEALFFDVNETLLDLGGLRAVFGDILGTTEPVGEWFARLLHGSLVANHLGAHRPFDVLATEALFNLVQRRGLEATHQQLATVVAGMKTLAAHGEVEEALGRLQSAGFRMAALTNNSPEVLDAQLTHAGIAGYFERRITVEEVGLFKPAPEVYFHAAAAMEVEVPGSMMIAAHDWDVAGAMKVGMRGAFLARSGATWGLPGPQPEVIVADLATLARILEGR
ncbi:MAG: haloacid dehalogenase type II [Actinomycetota bacterium]